MCACEINDERAEENKEAMHNLNHWMVWLWANAQYDRTTRSTLSRKKMHSLATGSASFRLHTRSASLIFYKPFVV